MAYLLPCVSCGRHVRAVESSCPFCDAPRTPASCEGPCGSAARATSRAAILFAGAAAVAGCMGAYGPAPVDHRPPTVEPDGGATAPKPPDPSPTGSAQPTAKPTAQPTAKPDPGPVAVYGPPPINKK
jgi:hypothetical protein